MNTPLTLRRVLGWLVLLLVVGGLAFGGWWWFFPSDARQIQALFRKLEGIASIAQGQSNFVRLGKASRLIEVFAVDARVTASIPGLGEHQVDGLPEIETGLRSAHQRLQTLRIELTDPAIDLTPGATNGLVLLAGVIRTEAESPPTVLEIRAQMQKRKEGWRIQGLELRPPLGFQR